ncbi:MAG: hypothetical protein QXM75_03450 [Candidatus Diapherotrites archaeon]
MEEEFDIGSAEPEQHTIKRQPAVECFLNEVKGSERRIAAVVSVVAVNPSANTMLVSDGTSEAVVVAEDSTKIKKLKPGTIVRIIASPSNTSPLTLNLEIVQELKEFDPSLFRKVKEIWSKLNK